MRIDYCHIGCALDILPTLPDESVQMCVTSPPYWGLRDYGAEGQLGLEPTPEEYVANMVRLFAQVRRVLKADGVLWLNLGDSYARNPAKGGSGPNGKERAYIGDVYGRAAGRRQWRDDEAGAPDPSGVVGGFPDGGRDFSMVGGGNGGSRNGDACSAGLVLKEKDLVGIPWRVAFALQADGWYLRQDIIWHKPNPMPESVTDRCTKAHEYLFMITKSARYYYDAGAIAEKSTGRERWFGDCGYSAKSGRNDGLSLEAKPGLETRNRRSVWTVSTEPYPEAHFAVFPPKLIEPCILATSKVGDVVLDPFMGSGTTAQVAQDLGRHWVGCELNPEYVALQAKRTAQQSLAL